MSLRRFTKGALLLALLAPSTLGSCAADSVSLRVTCNVAPEADCTYTEGGLCQSQGMLNLGAGTGSYFAMLKATSGLKPRKRDVPPQSEPNGLEVNEVEVHVTDSAGREPDFPPSLPNPFTVPANGFAEPDGDALVGVDLLPAAYVGQIKVLRANGAALGSVQLSIILRAKTSGGENVESGGWHWTVKIIDKSTDPARLQCEVFEDKVCVLGQDGASYASDPALVEKP